MVLESLGKSGSSVAIIMREQEALTDPQQQVKEANGSGPYKFANEQWVPGSKAVYKKFTDYVPGFQLIKAGVFLMDLQPASVQQGELEREPEVGRDRTRLMAAMDALNGRFGKGTLHVGSTGLQGATQTWGMRQERRTPQYTTRWDDVPVARA